MEMSQNNGNKPKNEAWWQPAVFIFMRLSGWIVIPVIIALVFGKWLQGKIGYEPWTLFGCIAIAFVVSMVGLLMSAVKEMKGIDKK